MTTSNVPFEVGDMKDLVLKWVDLVLEQTNDLWTISLGFFVAAVLILAHLHAKQTGKVFLFLLLYLSALSTAFSLFLAYKVKGSLISSLETMATNKSWSMPQASAWDSLLQLGCFATGVLLFIFAFAIWRTTLASALIGAKGG